VVAEEPQREQRRTTVASGQSGVAPRCGAGRTRRSREEMHLLVEDAVIPSQGKVL
jgi:hypothetical protein